MKNCLLIIVISVFISQRSIAQNTEWPSPTGSQNVGIGTNSPTSRLEVASSGWGWLLNLRPTASSPGQFSGIKLSSGYLVEDWKWGGIATIPEDQHSNNTALALYANSGEKIRLSANGNVGIGTTAPISMFQISNNWSKACIGEANGADLAWGTTYFGFNAARKFENGQYSWSINGDGTHNGGGVIYTTIFGDIMFSTIEHTGIGSKILSDLDVKSRINFRIAATGTTYAKAIKVETENWPDHVFAPQYKLSPLSYLKAFVNKNRHLPGIPTEADVKKDGIDLGEMNKLLLTKVEELTLYMVQKDEQLKKQQEVIKGLVDRIQLIEKKISKHTSSALK